MTIHEKSRSNPLDRLVGTWTTEATHPGRPGVIVHGTTVVTWLEGERFLSLLSSNDHPDFPGALSVIGDMGHDRGGGSEGTGQTNDDESQLRMHYYDSRGVFRICEVGIDDAAWRVWRKAPGFSQRFTGEFSENHTTIAGRWELCRDDIHWEDDLQITYRRQG